LATIDLIRFLYLLFTERDFRRTGDEDEEDEEEEEEDEERLYFFFRTILILSFFVFFELKKEKIPIV